MTQYLGWLFGFENVRSVDSISVSFAAPWVGEQMWALLGCCLLAIGGVVVFYRRYESCNTRALRLTLTFVRAALLCFLLVTLAAPVVHSGATVLRLPTVYLVADDSESMTVADVQDGDSGPVTRTEQLRRLLSDQGGALVQRLEEEAKCHVELFKLANDALSKVDRQKIESGLVGEGKTTPLLGALASLPRSAPATAIVLSDFVDTSSGVKRDELLTAISSIGIRVHSVGLGATELTDIAIDMRTEMKVKRGEPTTITIDLRQSGLDLQDATVTLEARPLEYEATSEDRPVQSADERTVTLDAATKTLELTFVPETAGVVELVAKVTSFDREVLLENNVATRQIGVIEDYLRITYVDYEPNWEWRQIKEVFGRDDLVGRDGFRAYLASAAENVRSENTLFNNFLVSPRSEFYANDVFFIGDAPSELFTPEFCDLAEEFVSRLGGGLVVVAGPRFGPGQLADTPLAKMLPVIVNADSRLRDQSEYMLQRTSGAALYPFMQLAETEAEDAAAWNNLGKLPWYQPVAGLHEHSQVLAEHPTDLCDDGKTRQPLIAIRPYGKGQVVYVGFNEMWRLRRRYGNRYYQRFWSQLIYRLGMSHAVGADKRFVAQFDRHVFPVGEDAMFSVDAFDDEYQPLGLSQLTEGALIADLSYPTEDGQATRKLSLQSSQPGHFETIIPISSAGRYSVRITDPITDKTYERTCVASEISLEKREVIRDSELQRRIAAATGGKAYDISQVDKMIRELELEPTFEQEHRQVALWNTPLWFLFIVGLMLSEWTLRKLAFLR
ncbi:MAG: hypothetical protein H8E66_33640 [Planctomycetes bacterium]|nr:hypothetical protein [Planctomycetota bacterium]